jgi:hypothetical protein
MQLIFLTRPIKGAAVEEFHGTMRASEARLKSVSPEELDSAPSTVAEYLLTGWSTRGGRRLRHFIWSLWNGWHLVNLFDLSHGLDGVLTDAIITLFRTAMVGALTEDHLRCLLSESGEMRPGKRLNMKRQKGMKSSTPLPL